MTGDYWLTKILVRFFLIATVLTFLLSMTTGAWEPFLGAVFAGVFMVPFTAWLESWSR